jgi:hypothetical protein
VGAYRYRFSNGVVGFGIKVRYISIYMRYHASFFVEHTRSSTVQVRSVETTKKKMRKNWSDSTPRYFTCKTLDLTKVTSRFNEALKCNASNS